MQINQIVRVNMGRQSIRGKVWGFSESGDIFIKVFPQYQDLAKEPGLEYDEDSHILKIKKDNPCLQ